jgi:hypothetical protein
MADYRATWARIREMAWACFPNDEVATENTTRETFDAEETAVYAADQEATNEEHAMLEAARRVTRLREELRAEATVVEDPLDDVNKDENNEDLTDFSDGEAKGVTDEQRALLACFETKRHAEASWQFMVAERRATTEMVVAARQCRDAHYPLPSYEPW